MMKRMYIISAIIVAFALFLAGRTSKLHRQYVFLRNVDVRTQNIQFYKPFGGIANTQSH